MRYKSSTDIIMEQSNLSFNIAPPALELLKISLFKFPPLTQKSRLNAPPIFSTEIPLLKGKFHLQSNTVHASQREICRNDTFKLLLKTHLKELFPDKGEILSRKSVKHCKPPPPQKKTTTHGRITLEQEINPVQIPHPSNATFKFPAPWA